MVLVEVSQKEVFEYLDIYLGDALEMQTAQGTLGKRLHGHPELFELAELYSGHDVAMAH